MTVDVHAPAVHGAGRHTGHARLRAAAESVLDANWTGASTVPSRALYPHQWSWDSAFTAIGLRHHAPDRARRELRTLTDAQWGDGRIPHIVFHPSVPLGAYFPSPDFWRSSTAGAGRGAPAAVETSGIVQPPVHALAVWLVHQADPAGSRAADFLATLYPRLAAWHDYLTTARDLGGGGLPACVHPWEPGMDNSPAWDAPLRRVTPADPATFRRADLDHGQACDRPTDLDYGRYVALAADYRDRGYRDGGAPHPFAVEDPGTVSLLIVSEYALADIADELGRDGAPHRARAAALTDALVTRLWDADAGMFLSRDVRADALLPERSAAGLLPLIVPGLPAPQTGALLATLAGPHFALGGACPLAPSYDLTGHAHDGSRYWRGPAWFNVNWLLERGLRRCGRNPQADVLRARMLASADSSAFAEYVDPRSGEAHGTRSFAWTAALTLDLLATTPAASGPASGGALPGPRTATEADPAPEPDPDPDPARAAGA